MNPFKSSVVDDSEKSASVRTRPEKKLENYSGGDLSKASGEVSASPCESSQRGNTYFERKVLASLGIWGRVKETKEGCWEWTGPTSDGYGIVTIAGRAHRVHRLIAEIFFGKLGPKDLACHRCGNRRCFNPKHVIVGDHGDNNCDTIEHSGKPRPVRKPRK